MKQIQFLFFGLFICLSAFSQTDDIAEPFFKKENIFTGGTCNFSFGDNITSVGASPYVGYSFNKFFDMAFSFGVNYISQRNYSQDGDKLRQTVYTPAVFARVFPAKFFFGQLQYEYNLISDHYIPAIGSYYSEEKQSYQAKSILLGAGISNGKDFPYQKSYYYFSVLWDVGKDVHSPYKDNLNRAVPIIRAGYNIALFQGMK